MQTGLNVCNLQVQQILHHVGLISTDRTRWSHSSSTSCHQPRSATRWSRPYGGCLGLSSYADRWWASSSDAHKYPSIFAFPLLPLHCWSTSIHPCTNITTCDHTTITLASLDWSHLFDGYMFYDSHVLFLFLVAPTCALLWSDQSWTLALHVRHLL